MLWIYKKISLTDTIALDKIDDLENKAYNFTRSEKPEEPFLSGLTEPLIAVSAIAVSIYLLFSVRSNWETDWYLSTILICLFFEV